MKLFNIKYGKKKKKILNCSVYFDIFYVCKTLRLILKILNTGIYMKERI